MNLNAIVVEIIGHNDRILMEQNVKKEVYENTRGG